MNTGYIINTYKDVNPYSSKYNSIKTERIYDIITCPLPLLGDIVYKVDIPTNNFLDVDAVTKPYKYNGSNASIIIDWGDGIVESVGGTIQTVSHTYITAGIYIVKIKVDEIIQELESSIGISNRTSEIISYQLSFGSIFNIMNTSGLDVITELSPQPFNLNRTRPQDGENIGVFIGSNYLTTVNGGDWSNIFANGYGNYGIFSFCTSLKTVSSDILKGVRPKSLGSFFNYCSNLEMNIDTFFADVDLSECENVASLFENCSKITGSGQAFINRLGHITSSSNYAKCFKNCTSLSDYNHLPINWKT